MTARESWSMRANRRVFYSHCKKRKYVNRGRFFHQDYTMDDPEMTSLVRPTLSVSGLTSLLLQNEKSGLTCEICFKVLSSKNNLKVRNSTVVFGMSSISDLVSYR